MDRRAALVTQVLMTSIMALSMSGIMSLVALGPTAEWLSRWPKQFAIAWPIAFVLPLMAMPLVGRLTRILLRR